MEEVEPGRERTFGVCENLMLINILKSEYGRILWILFEVRDGHQR